MTKLALIALVAVPLCTFACTDEGVDDGGPEPLIAEMQIGVSIEGSEGFVLIADGADIHALDTRNETAGGNGRRPLNHAALSNDVEMINTLLELGADINRQNLSGFTPLHHAVEVEAEEAIALLVSKGADRTIENGRNLTPQQFATVFNRPRAAAALAKAVEGQ